MTKTRQISAVAFFAAIILTTLFCVVWYQRRCATFCSATSDQIESPQGFTYTMALYYLERGKVRVPSPSEELIPNWEIIRNKAVAQGVEPLVANGYTPKWMDKLLKMPEPEAYYVPDYY